jgi:hypothetical protein
LLTSDDKNGPIFRKVMLENKKILWHVDPLLGDDLDISSYTIAVGKLRFFKQRSLPSNIRNRHARNSRRAVVCDVLCVVRAEVI